MNKLFHSYHNAAVSACVCVCALLRSTWTCRWRSSSTPPPALTRAAPARQATTRCSPTTRSPTHPASLVITMATASSGRSPPLRPPPPPPPPHTHTSPCFTSLHFTFHFSLHFTSVNFTSPHFTSPHLTSLHFFTFHFTPVNFTSLHLTFHLLCSWLFSPLSVQFLFTLTIRSVQLVFGLTCPF